MNVNVGNVGVKGFYLAQVKDAITHEVKHEIEFQPNLITNTGLNMLGGQFVDSENVLADCFVSTDTTEPLITDGSLSSTLAWQSSKISASHGNSVTAPFYIFERCTWRFEQGQVVGNVSKFAVGVVTNTSTRAHRAFSIVRIKDSGGNPTTLPVTALDYLEVTYELRSYLNVSDVVLPNVVLDGVSHTIVARPSGLGTNKNKWRPRLPFYNGIAWPNGFPIRVYNGAAGTHLQDPSGDIAYLNNSEAQYTHLMPYVADSYQRTIRVLTSLTNGNVPGGARCLLLSFSNCDFKLEFDPPVNKTATKYWDMYLTFGWGRQP